jgi:hypothetical protein
MAVYNVNPTNYIQVLNDNISNTTNEAGDEVVFATGVYDDIIVTDRIGPLYLHAATIVDVSFTNYNYASQARQNCSANSIHVENVIGTVSVEGFNDRQHTGDESFSVVDIRSINGSVYLSNLILDGGSNVAQTDYDTENATYGIYLEDIAGVVMIGASIEDRIRTGVDIYRKRNAISANNCFRVTMSSSCGIGYYYNDTAAEQTSWNLYDVTAINSYVTAEYAAASTMFAPSRSGFNDNNISCSLNGRFYIPMASSGDDHAFYIDVWTDGRWVEDA